MSTEKEIMQMTKILCQELGLNAFQYNDIHSLWKDILTTLGASRKLICSTWDELREYSHAQQFRDD